MDDCAAAHAIIKDYEKKNHFDDDCLAKKCVELEMENNTLEKKINELSNSINKKNKETGKLNKQSKKFRREWCGETPVIP